MMVALYSGPVTVDASVLRLAELSLLGAEAYPDGVFEGSSRTWPPGTARRVAGSTTSAPRHVSGLHDVRDGRRLKVLVDSRRTAAVDRVRSGTQLLNQSR
ncbi:hypothetical protein [Streptomyces sp. F001]|uniref:hypothetical protein n=1 Tax=Streptomyces sp. F001 TaxID=1510026 RepID=UPI0019CF81C9|nr:hypothetical protein [Streptomyces sp. F001]